MSGTHSSGRALGGVLWGTEARLVDVQVDIRGGLPGLEIVGLADRAVSEAAYRVRTALANSGCRLPPRKVVVNLAPAWLPKRGTALDLAIAAAVLMATGHPVLAARPGAAFWGEVSLDGAVIPAVGELPFALAAARAGAPEVVVSGPAASLAGLAGLPVLAIGSLADLLGHRPVAFPAPAVPDPSRDPSDQGGKASPGRAPGRESDRCLQAIAGLAGPLRCAKIAAGGGHHALFRGPPGSGKSLLARAVHSLLPPLDPGEAVVVAAIGSAAAAAKGVGDYGRPEAGLPPLRAPAPTSSPRDLLGGGLPPVPGEFTLAHGGLLLLDELPAFRGASLAALAAVLDAREVEVGRRGQTAAMPARFVLAATTNLCPCGRTGSPSGGCGCTNAAKRSFWQRLGAPLLERIPLHVEVSGPEAEELEEAFRAGAAAPAPSRGGAGAARVRHEVLLSRGRQHQRYGGQRLNAEVDDLLFRERAGLAPDAAQLAVRTGHSLGLSARVVTNSLRLARTIADLENRDQVEAVHVAEALSYRPRPAP